MAKVIFKCNHIKSGNVNHKENMVGYIATRNGVQRLEIKNKDFPVTKKQEKFIEQLIKDFPDSKNLFEFEDYLQSKTLENATEFISTALEHNLEKVAKKENYVDYIANRPRVEKLTTHGLFNGGDEKIILSKIAKEVAEHDGAVWTPIISLRREDAIATGFDSAERWKDYLASFVPTLAESLKIPMDKFKWYAAFHNEGHHPHIHMICYSENPKFGFLDRKGIAKIKSELVSNIFKMEMHEVYAEQSKLRDELKAESKKAVEQLMQNILSGNMQTEGIEKLLVELSENLKHTKGKRVYGYLPPKTKQLVDAITDELCKQTDVAKAYDLWYGVRNEIISSYKSTNDNKLPLSQQKEFRSIKNHIIYEADKLSKGEISLTELNEVEQTEQESIAEDDTDDSDFTEPMDTEEEITEEQHQFVKWTDEYKQARVYLFGDKDNEPDFVKALELLQGESQRGNLLAVFDLGRIYADGLGVEIDSEKAQEYYTQALDGFESLEMHKPWKYLEYRIGKMYAQGLGTEQDYELSAEWFSKSAEQKYKFAEYSLGGLYYRGQGVEQSYEKAMELYLSSADQGFQWAQYALGKIYLTEESYKDIDKAVHWLTESADRNNQYAEYQLGKLYLQGEELTKNVEKAIHYLTSSAEQGNQYAQYILGKLYLMGKEVEQDKETAVKWFTLSAEQGNEYAQFFIDNMDKWNNPSVSSAAIRLLHHMSRIFEDNQPQAQKQAIGMKIDSKRLRKLREKKLAAGHKVDDISPQMVTY